jgi:hypothetical protein
MMVHLKAQACIQSIMSSSIPIIAIVVALSSLCWRSIFIDKGGALVAVVITRPVAA